MGRPRNGVSYISDHIEREHTKLLREAGIIVGPGEVVHHIDENRRNNELSNLQVMSRGDHSKLHWGRSGEPGYFDLVKIECGFCGDIREVEYRTLRRPSFTGLCSPCNRTIGKNSKKEYYLND